MHASFQNFPPLRGSRASESELPAHMRALAAGMQSTSFAAIEPPHEAKKTLLALRRAIEHTPAQSLSLPVQRAAQAAVAFETMDLRRSLFPRRTLPAVDRRARILLIVREILLCCDGAPTPERFESALHAFCETRALSMEELACVPDALRAEALRLFVQAVRGALWVQQQQAAAERWLSGHGPLRTDCCFLEHALHLCREEDGCACEKALSAAIAAEEGGAPGIVARAHERQARLCLWLENLPSAMHLAANMDIKRLLEASDAARLLFSAPFYTQCDEETRAMLRARIVQTARIAKRAESIIVRAALHMSSQADPGTLRAQGAWYFLSDEGRRALFVYIGCDIPFARRIVPDPRGTLCLCTTALCTLGLMCLFRLWQAPLLLLPGLLLCQRAAMQAMGCLCARFFAPRALPRLAMEQIPPALRTLVVVPAITPTAGRARTLAAQLEIFAAHETDPNIEFCLLADFPDAPEQHLPGDAAVLAAAREAIDRANDRLGAKRIHYLHREREWNAASRRYMGHERKRGALCALNALLLRGENAFSADGADAPALCRRFRFVITLDADARPYPGHLRKLIDALAHPVNALGGICVLQPRMTRSIAGEQSPFLRLMAGTGGTSGYGGQSEMYQDLCGQGGFSGKGIYDVAAFDRQTGSAFPDNAILSHDLIEGFLAGSAFASDIVLLDNFPGSLRAYFQRLHRWTRGDWQLLPFLRGRTLLQKYRMLDNLCASLTPPAALLCIFGGLHWQMPALLLAALLPFFCGALFAPLHAETWLRALASLSILPNEAVCRLDAAVRALYRTFISHRNMLEWVSAADAENGSGKTPVWPRIVCAALCLLLSLGNPAYAIGVLFAALFLSGAPVLEKMERVPAERPLNEEQRAFLGDLAADTWRFFDAYTCESGFPPDNVQFDPPRGAAGRTSPTNIGLYMASCVAAQQLSLIGRAEMHARLETTVQSLERIEKWHGLPYNWYDPDDCRPLHPRYVSSVDSGNLAACLLLCAQAVSHDNAPLAARLKLLACGMDLDSLFDQTRRLFYIGYDVEKDALSASHYDLLASEARILSFVAILLKKAPVCHWARLSRAETVAAGHALPVSWSGTMFEYLLPELFLPTPRHSLLGNACRICVEAQRRQPCKGYWGISESGYYAFDAHRNFQYRAFGVRELMLRDDGTARVIAPYASALALLIDPAAATENLHKMRNAGFTTPCGLVEAIDFSPERISGSDYGIVRSAMAHHQGMILLSCANALCEGRVRALFAEQSGVQALLPLLEEPPVQRRGVLRRGQIHRHEESAPPVRPASRPAQRDILPPDSMLISGAQSSLYLRADGQACWHMQDICVNRFSPDWHASSGFFTHLRENGGECCSLLDAPARFFTGSAEFHRHCASLDTRVCFTVSPEDGALLRHVRLQNRTSERVCIELRDIALLSLCTDAQAAEHPAFHDLFLECAFPAPNALRITRRPREEGSGVWTLDYTVAGLLPQDTCELFADRACMLSRGADPSSAQDVFASACRRSRPGAGISPLQGARIVLQIAPQDTRTLVFSTLVGHNIAIEHDRYADTNCFLRARRLCESQNTALLRFLGISGCVGREYGRAVSMCMYSRPFFPKSASICTDAGANQLWPLGISGDRPVLTAYAGKSMRAALDIVRLHVYLQAMGMPTDAVLLCDDQTGYDQPARDRLVRLLRDHRLQTSGVYIISTAQADKEALSALERLSAVCLRDGDTLCSLSHRPQPVEPPHACVSGEFAFAPVPGENYGEFIENGRAYRIALHENGQTPVAWCNVLAGENMGALVDENGGGFAWYRNSRNMRITPFDNDPLGGGSTLYLTLEEGDAQIALIPRSAHMPAEITVRQGESRMRLCASGLSVTITRYTDVRFAMHCAHVHIEYSGEIRPMRLRARCRFLMGVRKSDLRALHISTMGDMILAAGAAPCAACLRLPHAHAQDGELLLDILCGRDRPFETTLILCAADTVQAAARLALEYTPETALQAVRTHWQELLSRVQFETGDAVRDRLLDHWMPYQTISARLLGRAGLYQGGGAYGFRDQLQDVLCMIPIDPARAREHLLLCAAHQFPEGDVQHWWHPPYTGVRTRISDDRLFLPWVAARYVLESGDSAILSEPVAYLSGEPLPPGKHDHYFDAQPSDLVEPLAMHCMRAIRLSASSLGVHSLPLMGCGDWNDGMDRIGALGRGESVWLAEFLCVVARDLAAVLPEHSKELLSLSARMLSAVERHAWDGDRYLRAFRDDGSPLGSSSTQSGCQIDALSQSWAVLAGCDRQRAAQAMDTLWRSLYDADNLLLRLLDPPFDGNIASTGYIAAYPPGIRENGGQYTHAACWALMAYAKLGDRARAWTLLRALLPSSHTDIRERADIYRAEPYALAGDVYSFGAAYCGRAGWTWYTGAAGWLFRAFLTGIAGFERRGGKVRLCALLDEDMDELCVRLRVGSSEWSLISRRGCPFSGWADLSDDGRKHTVLFSAR